jgi:hypothetical protein
MDVCRQFHAAAALPPRKSPRYPLYSYIRLGSPQSRPGRCKTEKKRAFAPNPTPAVQPVARRYADWAIRMYIL